MFLILNRDYVLKYHHQLIFVMVNCCVLFEVQTKFLNIIYTDFGFKGLIMVLMS
jgi:hypothetical protein